MEKTGHMTNDRTVEISEVFRLLGDPTRLRIVLACLDTAESVGDIAHTVGASPSLVSHHLRLLRAARLVRAERRGKQVYYTAADEHVRCILVDMVAHVSEPELETI
ncbi:MAG: winged helix-turn-helix transcriptional regulator [Rhodospirillales bacterium]|nr:winged helix-turn-helix transcriptional regulator [Rhodospirillales bacterium]